MQIRVFDHDRHVDLRLGGIGDTAHEVARRQQAAVGIGARARESEILERNAVTLQEQRSVERTQRAYDRRIACRRIARTFVDGVVIALKDLGMDALRVARGLMPDRLLTTNFVGR